MDVSLIDTVGLSGSRAFNLINVNCSQPRYHLLHPLLPDIGFNLGGGQIDARQPRTATMPAPDKADCGIKNSPLPARGKILP